MLIQLIQNYICIGIFAQIYTDTHSFTAGMIVQVCNSVDFFVTDKLCDLFYQAGLIYQIRKFCNNNAGLSIRKSFNICHCADTDFAAACAISLLNSSCSENRCSSRKIRSFYNFKNLLNTCITLLLNDIINDLYHSLNNLPEIMGRNIRCHTYGNSRGTVYKKIWIAGRKHYRLPFCFIKVRLEINCIFVDICQHFHGNLAETCLGVSHGSRAVAIHRTKVSMSVNQRISG